MAERTPAMPAPMMAKRSGRSSDMRRGAPRAWTHRAKAESRRGVARQQARGRSPPAAVRPGWDLLLVRRGAEDRLEARADDGCVGRAVVGALARSSSTSSAIA